MSAYNRLVVNSVALVANIESSILEQPMVVYKSYNNIKVIVVILILLMPI